MNNTYYETLDKNFNDALSLFEQEFTHEELIELLENGNILQKQFAALNLDTVKCKREAEILLNNLTGQDGKVRDAVSLKLKDLFVEFELRSLFYPHDYSISVFLEAITDINGNICRNIIEAISYFKTCEDFCAEFCPLLTNKINGLIRTVQSFNAKDRKYKVNKELFKLYWCLETLNIFYDKVNISDLKNILMVTKNINEYTIREKTAKILSHSFNDRDLLAIKYELKNDSNYYVRRF